MNFRVFIVTLSLSSAGASSVSAQNLDPVPTGVGAAMVPLEAYRFPEEPVSKAGDLELLFSNRLAQTSALQLNPFSLGLLTSTTVSPYHAREAAQAIALGSLSDSLSEYALAGIDRFELAGTVYSFLNGIIGNADERDIRPLSLGPDITPSELFQDEDRDVVYGVRVFSQSPYAYGGFRLKNSAGEEIVSGYVRYYYRIGVNQQRIESDVSFPMPYGCHLNLSEDCFSSPRSGSGASCTLQLLGRIGRGGYWFVGGKAGNHSDVLMGVICPWFWKN